MAFVDEIKLHLKAGKGGDGVVRWLHEKGKPLMGPAGGDGGNGGDVYVKAFREMHGLARYARKKSYEAENGDNGAKNSLHGKGGDDLILDFPIGTIIINQSTGEKFSLIKEGEKIMLLKGGRGGLGNERFKSSTNRSPKEFTLGKEGEEADFLIELQLFADLGFAGLPNAGKTSLLNVLTRAEGKVADYAFTTLEPNLGDMHGFIIADIPGLIEGASEGKGLGHKFLRHIKRTSVIAHVISLENKNLNDAYKTIRAELEAFDKDLAKKKEIIILTKTDILPDGALSKIVTSVKKLNKDVYTVSLYDDKSIKDLEDNLVKLLRKATAENKEN
ncbi:MAG: GTPase ObgE [Parcubacteria group bacterium LiPW_30]|nr:MAG: GTPase ObgE [Parcubacteria group bacterium LiPW_30]